MERSACAAFNGALEVKKKDLELEVFFQPKKWLDYNFCIAMKESKRLSAKRNQAT